MSEVSGRYPHFSQNVSCNKERNVSLKVAVVKKRQGVVYSRTRVVASSARFVPGWEIWLRNANNPLPRKSFYPSPHTIPTPVAMETHSKTNHPTSRVQRTFWYVRTNLVMQRFNAHYVFPTWSFAGINLYLHLYNRGSQCCSIRKWKHDYFLSILA